MHFTMIHTKIHMSRRDRLLILIFGFVQGKCTVVHKSRKGEHRAGDAGEGLHLIFQKSTLC